MRIEQLRQMVELARTGSMNQAAANLFMSQPNLSISIRNLEEELGVTLVMRGNRGVTLTSRGERFVEYAESVLDQFDRLGDLCQRFDQGPAPVFSLASCRYRFVVDAAARLSQESDLRPISLNLTEGSRDEIVERVRKGNSEIGVIGMMSIYRKDLLRQFRAKELRYQRLSACPLSVAVGEGSPLYHLPSEEVLTTHMLEGFPQVSYEQMDYIHYTDRRQKMKIPAPPNVFQVSGRAAAHELLAKTDAYLITHTDMAVYRSLQYYPGVRLFALSDMSVTNEVGWICREGAVLSPLAKTFLDILGSYFEH